jgi:hypothetical protein
VGFSQLAMALDEGGKFAAVQLVSDQLSHTLARAERGPDQRGEREQHGSQDQRHDDREDEQEMHARYGYPLDSLRKP